MTSAPDPRLQNAVPATPQDEVGLPPSARSSPLIGWRIAALLYDFFPALGLWFMVAAVFTALHHDAVVGGLLGLLEFIGLWAITGAYATLSWRRGGQTLGMRPWRLRVSSVDGGIPSWRAVATRYSIGSLSLLAAGLGFWWAWIDRDRLTWHDRASGTRVKRESKDR